MAIQKYILTQRMHLGYVKDTFGAGTILEFDDQTYTLKIDGRRMETYKDIEVLRRQAMREPNKAWVINFSPEALQAIRGESSEALPIIEQRHSQGMPIVQSDEDDHRVIDISHTKISDINNAKRAADRNRRQNQPMETIRGDETVEDRIARLKNARGDDMQARAERIRLLQSPVRQMPKTRDDSLGYAGGGRTEMSRNAGMIRGVREEDASEFAAQEAEWRKQEVEARRRNAAIEAGLNPDDPNVEVGVTPDELAYFAQNSEQPADMADRMTGNHSQAYTPDEELRQAAEVHDSQAEDEKDAEIARLKAQIAAANAPEPEPEPMDPRDAEIARLKAELAGSSHQSEPVKKVKKIPAVQEPHGV